MKRLLLVVLGSCLISGAAWAGSYTYTPDPANMYNLPHPYCFSWTIDLASTGFDPNIEAITSATVNFHQINNWKQQPNTLFVTLMDPIAAVPLGVGVYGNVSNDELMSHTLANEWTLKDAGNWRLMPSWFESRLEVGTYSDTDGNYGNTAPYSDVPIIFGGTALTTLNTYAGDSRITIGFDPDCHYYNSGIDLTIKTTPKQNDNSVPEPMSLLLGVMGLASVAGLRRLRK